MAAPAVISKMTEVGQFAKLAIPGSMEKTKTPPRKINALSATRKLTGREITRVLINLTACAKAEITTKARGESAKSAPRMRCAPRAENRLASILLKSSPWKALGGLFGMKQYFSLAISNVDAALRLKTAVRLTRKLQTLWQTSQQVGLFHQTLATCSACAMMRNATPAHCAWCAAAPSDPAARMCTTR